MKITCIVISIIILFSVANAETYKWEDANGMHFTDNAASIPEKYREKVLSESKESGSELRPQTTSESKGREVLPTQGASRTADSLIKLDRNRTRGQDTRPLQTPVYPSKTSHAPKTIEEALMPLAKFMTIAILVGIFLFLVWLSTLLNIILSNFKESSNKIIWFLLVFFLPVIGILLYWLIGYRQKDGEAKPRERDRGGSVTRLYTDKEKDGEFSL